MSCKIVIPSHKRAENVLTTELVYDPILCVEEAQEGEYREHNPDVEIVTHPNEIKGLVPKRNWMARKFGELFMLDDDIMSFNKVYGCEGTTGSIKEKSFVTARIYELHDRAKLLGVPLFGFTKNQRPTYHKPFKPFRLDAHITGCAYGMIWNEKLYWHEDLKLKEDFWISGLVKHYHRKILTDTRYCFTQKDTFVNPGGLSSIRNQENEWESMLMVRKYFGKCVSLKTEKWGSKKINKLNITMKFDF